MEELLNAASKKNVDQFREVVMDMILMFILFVISIFFLLVSLCQFTDGNMGSAIIYLIVSICSVAFVVLYKKGNIKNL